MTIKQNKHIKNTIIIILMVSIVIIDLLIGKFFNTVYSFYPLVVAFVTSVCTLFLVSKLSMNRIIKDSLFLLFTLTAIILFNYVTFSSLGRGIEGIINATIIMTLSGVLFLFIRSRKNNVIINFVSITLMISVQLFAIVVIMFYATFGMGH